MRDPRAVAPMWRVAWLCGCLAILAGVAPARAAQGWGASADLTSDYLVRGISRSAGDPALQFDVHYATSLGLFAGASLSNARVNPREPWDGELGVFVGYRYAVNDDFSTRVLYSHYAYPWNAAGREYDYDELEAQISYQGWLQLDVSYSPNYSRFVTYPYPELLGVSEESVELNVQRTLVGRLSAAGGVGYAYVSGPGATGYVYVSAGLAYELGRCTLAASYVNTSSAAKSLFYNNAASNQLLATVIWRF